MKLSRCTRWWLSLSVAALLAGAFAGAEEGSPHLDVPYVPTPQIVVDKMLEMARVTKEDVVWDLGCGDGRIVVSAAKKGARAIGCDIDPQRIQEANENARKAGVTDRVRFTQQDLFKTDFSEATVLTLYLFPSINLRLRPTILRDLKPGTRVISHDFSMDDWLPDQQVEIAGPDRDHTLYYWVVPARVEGTWKGKIAFPAITYGLSRVPAAEHPLTLTLKQKFQRVSGDAASDTLKGEVREGTLQGTRISFTVEGGQSTARFRGTAAGSAMAGKVTIVSPQGNREVDWSATKQ